MKFKDILVPGKGRRVARNKRPNFHGLQSWTVVKCW